MTMIQIPFDADTAHRYQRASAEEKKKLRLLMNLWLREFEKPSVNLDQLMDDISRRAKQCGLTPELLKSILDG